MDGFQSLTEQRGQIWKEMAGQRKDAAEEQPVICLIRKTRLWEYPQSQVGTAERSWNWEIMLLSHPRLPAVQDHPGIRKLQGLPLGVHIKSPCRWDARASQHQITPKSPCLDNCLYCRPSLALEAVATDGALYGSREICAFFISHSLFHSNKPENHTPISKKS